MRTQQRGRTVTAIVLLFLAIITPVVCIVRQTQFTQQCGGYLKQTADATSVELALERINLAIEYIEKNDLKDGYTSILWKTENENIGFWYRNVIACRDELAANLDSSSLEQSNVLMKVREALTDDGDSGLELTVPPGISRYPHNTGYCVLNIISAILALIALKLLCGDDSLISYLF